MNNWILVENELPEIGIEVLVTTDFGDLEIAYRSEEGWHLAFNEYLFVHKPIAWQMLPTPYDWSGWNG